MRSTTQRGFTLVEMLVVIAVVMLLIALLFPIVVRAKDKANIIMCVNNMRSIGLTNISYAIDHGGHFPHYQAEQPFGAGELYVGWENTVTWPMIRAHFEYLTGQDYGPYGGTGFNTLLAENRKFQHENMSHFYCPSPRASKAALLVNSSTYLSNYYCRLVHHTGGHGWNGPDGGWIMGVHNPKAWILTEKLWSPSIKIAGTTIKPGPYDIIFANGTYMRNARHTNNIMPILRFDGSAEAYVQPRSYGSPEGPYGDIY